MTDVTQPDWDPRAESVLQNQRQAYDKMRQSCPVARSSDGQWTLFRHADVMRVLEDHQSFSNQVSQHISVPNGMDPPKHSLYRALIEPYFSQARVDWFEPICQKIADEVAQAAVQKDAIDLMSAFAYPFAARIQCAFMGWPQELADVLLDWLKRSQVATLARDRSATAALADEFTRIIRAQLEQRRQTQAHQDTDITSELMHEQVNGRPLTEAEIASILRNWTAGEVSTIAAAIGVIAHYLACNPELQAELRQHPDKLWYANDEIQRLHNPLLENRRRTTCPVEIGGRAIAAEQPITLNWVAANRDPEVFDNPEQFSWQRNPKQNLLYGAGIHVCPGAPLARMELVVAISSLLKHCSTLQLVPNRSPVFARYPASGYSKLCLRIR